MISSVIFRCHAFNMQIQATWMPQRDTGGWARTQAPQGLVKLAPPLTSMHAAWKERTEAFSPRALLCTTNSLRSSAFRSVIYRQRIGSTL